MPQPVSKKGDVYLLLEEIMHQYMLHSIMWLIILFRLTSRKRKRSAQPERYSMIHRMPSQMEHLNKIVGATDTDCIVNLRMDRNSFGRLCIMLKDLGGLVDGKYVSVAEQIAMFLGILAHHKKNRLVRFDFWRSGQTISHYMHLVLKAVLRLHGILLVTPKPVTDEESDPRWKWFKGCLGALDGSYINVTVPFVDKPKYMTRKGQIATNTFAVCDRNLSFVYVFAGWEGSAADCRVLRDAVNRENGLKVPKGCYYLCDNGYANSDSFLSPYKGVRYHLQEWGPAAVRPQNHEEIFNMRHSKARNVIERAFGVLKKRWGILRSATYYPPKVQNRLIMACFLLHNFIRQVMDVDPMELLFDATHCGIDDEEEVEFIDTIEASPEWNGKRDEIAKLMWFGTAEAQ